MNQNRIYYSNLYFINIIRNFSTGCEIEKDRLELKQSKSYNLDLFRFLNIE